MNGLTPGHLGGDGEVNFDEGTRHFGNLYRFGAQPTSRLLFTAAT